MNFWQCTMREAQSEIARDLRTLGLDWYALRIERARLPVEIPPVMREVAETARDVVAVLNQIGAAADKIAIAAALETNAQIIAQRFNRGARTA